MQQINQDFDIPYYIFEEIVEYVEETAKGRYRFSKWDNIKSLLGMAKINRKIDTRASYFFNRKI